MYPPRKGPYPMSRRLFLIGVLKFFFDEQTDRDVYNSSSCKQIDRLKTLPSHNFKFKNLATDQNAQWTPFNWNIQSLAKY